MAREIERKYLVKHELLPELSNGVKMVQCYLVRSEKFTLRLRLADQKAFLTIKGRSSGISRSEFEYEIPALDALNMLKEFNPGNSVCKTRYCIDFAGHTWEVDVFEGSNSGLITAEIELNSEDEIFELPPWIASDISEDPRYRNANLAAHPYQEW